MHSLVSGSVLDEPRKARDLPAWDLSTRDLSTRDLPTIMHGISIGDVPSPGRVSVAFGHVWARAPAPLGPDPCLVLFLWVWKWKKCYLYQPCMSRP